VVLAEETRGGGGAADTPPVDPDHWLFDNTPLEVQVDELARQVVAARAEIANLRRDFSFWWRWADQDAAPILRYLAGHNAKRPARLALLDDTLANILGLVGTLAEQLRVSTEQQASLRKCHDRLCETTAKLSQHVFGALGEQAEKLENWMAATASGSQVHAEVHDKLAGKVDALALVVNGRLEAQEAELAELRADLSRFTANRPE
jgi:cell division protein FtsB